MKSFESMLEDKKIRSQMVANLAPQSQIIQSGGMDFWNKSQGISDPEATIAFHKNVNDATLAWGKSMKGADLNSKDIEDLLKAGPSIANDITKRYQEASQFKEKLPIEQQQANTGMRQAGVAERNVMVAEGDLTIKQGKAAGTDTEAVLKAQADVLKQVAASIETSGVSALPPGGRIDRETMGKFLLSQNPLTPKWAGIALQFVTEAQLQVASGKPLEDWQKRVVALAQNRYRANATGINPAAQGPTSDIRLNQPAGSTGTAPAYVPSPAGGGTPVPAGSGVVVPPPVTPSSNMTEANIQATMTSIKALRPSITDPAQLRQLAIKYLNTQK
jgi:hypothetical protein